MSDLYTPDGFYLPPVTTSCTKTFFQFLSAYKETIDFFYFTLRLAHRVDDTALNIAKALIPLENDEQRRARLQATIDNPVGAAREFNRFSQTNSRNISTNIADNFLWYISNIIQQAMRRKPEIIKSGETVKIEDIFNYPSRRGLINYLIDRKINTLSYGGLKQIERFLDDALNISLFNQEHDRNLLRILIEVRNIHSHNQGNVNRIFLDRVEDCLQDFDFDFKDGQKAHLNFDNLALISRVCVTAALELDIKASKKFGIERKKISTWTKSKRVG